MKPTGHAIFSCIIGLFVWYYFKSAGAAIVSFLTGIFIDLDHFFDYYANKHFTLSLKKVYDASCDDSFDKFYLLLNSYELVIALWVLIAAFSLGIFWKAVAIGFTQHMILDQLTNPLTVPGYFLIYRIMKGFKKESVTYKKEPL